MKIKIKEIVDFKGYGQRKKKNFITKLKLPVAVIEVKEKSDARDYWVRSISAIIASCKANNNEKIVQKITDIERDKNGTTNRRTIQQYDNNLKILSTFRDFNFRDLFPENYKILEKGLKKGEIIIQNDFEIKVQISLPFTFEIGEVTKVGAIWFVAIKNGYKRSQLGIFAELAFNFLSSNYSESYEVCPENILIVDAYSTRSVSYSMLQSGEIPSELQSTLSEIQTLLQ